MNILIPYSWLKEFLKTDLAPKDLANRVSASGPSIERWHETEDGDTVFDVEVTTNRIDAYSVFGFAREAFAILTNDGLDADLIEPKVQPIENHSGVNHPLTVDVDEKLCPRFTAVVIDGVTIGKSPKFMVERLEKVGERSLNNVVDITNYVMYELGQPMHVFDYDKIAGHKMTLRKSRVGEKLITLDGTERAIPEGSIVIEDDKQLIDLCGIMGGKNSAVDKDTKRVLLFVQTYDPHTIRKTTMQMGFRTEAAGRFEKGLEPEGVLPPLFRAADLLREHAGGIIASEIIDLYPKPPKPRVVSVDLPTIQKLLGVPIDLDRAVNILITLGFTTTVEDDVITAEVPSFRTEDITIGTDLVEEIARLYGYHNIPSLLPEGQIPLRSENKVNKWTKVVKTSLKDWGYTELFTNSATSKVNIEKFVWKAEDCIAIRNPLTEDFVYMRPNLLTTMLPAIAENFPRFPQLAVFELSKIYRTTKIGLPDEIRILEIVQTGTDVLYLKGTVEALLDQLGMHDIITELATDDTIFEPNTHGVFKYQDKEIGHIGILQKSIGQNYAIATALSIAKIYFDDVITLASDELYYREPSKFPPLVEDISFVVKADQPVGPIIEAIMELDSLIIVIDLLDTFAGQQIGEGNKSITLRITYQSHKKLLSDKDISPLREKIKNQLEQNFSASIRS